MSENVIPIIKAKKPVAPPIVREALTCLGGNDAISFHVRNIASVAHEANRQWARVNGDTNTKPWDETSGDHKLSLVIGVLFHLKNPNAKDSASHDCWWEEKRRTGWIFGPEKCEKKKTHPCCVPFNRLPKHQQLKDRLFRMTVRALIMDLSPANAPEAPDAGNETPIV
ncbi:MAG: hypothetical protein K0U66_04770 [Gammaproteobacteria bacterium]|nr:hypothetical protein [Gammaproteobacteria bacterium]